MFIVLNFVICYIIKRYWKCRLRKLCEIVMATVFAEVNVTNHSMDQIYRDMSSGNSLILDLIYFIISLTQIKNKSGPRYT